MPCTDAKPDSEAPGDGYRRAGRDGPTRHTQTGNSGREAAILNALIQGAPNKLIASQLKITEATVKVHVKAILRKIRVTNRTQAAIWALHHQPLPKVVDADDGEVALTAA